MSNIRAPSRMSPSHRARRGPVAFRPCLCAGKGLEWSVHVRVGWKSSGNLQMEELTISEVARRANGRRRYDPAILDRLAFIHVAQRLGFSLTEIGLLFEQRDAPVPLSERWQALAREKLADVERLIR